MEDKLQSRCSRIGRRNTLWRPTKMLSPTAQGPARESKKSKPHRASTRLSRQPAARCSTGRGDADPGGAAERRSADDGQLSRAPAPCGSGHSGERQATRRPVAQRPAPSGRGATGTAARGPSPRAARGTRRQDCPARHAALRQRQPAGAAPEPARQVCLHAVAPGPAPRRPAAGRGGATAPGNRQV